jgi:hypothetical protein
MNNILLVYLSKAGYFVMYVVCTNKLKETVTRVRTLFFFNLTYFNKSSEPCLNLTKISFR